MENQTALIATAGFALAGVAGYMYLNQSDDVVSENVIIGTTNISDLEPENGDESKTSWWSSFWGDQHKQQRVMVELKETTDTVDASIYD
jgi:hypothetical protein|tara:strand:- start:3164 stop:3430 length:267 start_codon:yes stop_codon:yes gene_type:complete